MPPPGRVMGHLLHVCSHNRYAVTASWFFNIIPPSNPKVLALWSPVPWANVVHLHCTCSVGVQKMMSVSCDAVQEWCCGSGAVEVVSLNRGEQWSCPMGNNEGQNGWSRRATEEDWNQGTMNKIKTPSIPSSNLSLQCSELHCWASSFSPLLGVTIFWLLFRQFQSSAPSFHVA